MARRLLRESLKHDAPMVSRYHRAYAHRTAVDPFDNVARVTAAVDRLLLVAGVGFAACIAGILFGG